jgi:hypothetical protein
VDNKIICACADVSEARKLVGPNQFAKLAEQKASTIIHGVKISTPDETNAVIIMLIIQLRNLFMCCPHDECIQA